VHARAPKHICRRSHSLAARATAWGATLSRWMYQVVHLLHGMYCR
jgi:hypothetical protein